MRRTPGESAELSARVVNSTGARDSFWISIRVRHLADLSVVHLNETGILFIDCLAVDDACGVVVRYDQVSIEAVHGGIDELDPQCPGAGLTSCPKPRTELILPMEDTSKGGTTR